MATACFFALASTADASAPFSETEALKQLRAAERAGVGVSPTADPTAALRDLALALPKLTGAAERRAERILARPPDGTGPYGGAWPTNADEQTVETPEFVVHYAEVPDCGVSDENCDEPDLADEDSNDIPDYVDATVNAVDESIQVENGELGWPDPKGDGDEGEPVGGSQADRFDVYLADLCDGRDFDPCVFGYASPDDNSDECDDAPFLCSAHLVIDNDYDYAEFGASGGELGLRVTIAHEYNHVLQFNLDSNQDAWLFESTATWAEEQVFPNDDDWVRTYMDTWATQTTNPLTKSAFKIYGSAIWNHWLENGDASYGPDVILNTWESSRDVTPKDYAVGAYNDAILDEGGAGFAQEFAAFTAATAEWNTGDGNLPDASELPAVQRLGKVNLGDKSQKQTLDNTTFALYDVNPKNAGQITLKGRSPGGVQWGLSLVGRTGDRFDGNTTRVVSYSVGDERQTATLPDAQSYNRITAIVTNADGRVAGPKPIFGGFQYTKNGQEFRLKVR